MIHPGSGPTSPTSPSSRSRTGLASRHDQRPHPRSVPRPRHRRHTDLQRLPTDTRPGTSPSCEQCSTSPPTRSSSRIPFGLSNAKMSREPSRSPKNSTPPTGSGACRRRLRDELSRILDRARCACTGARHRPDRPVPAANAVLFPRPGRASATHRSRRPCTTFPPQSARTPSLRSSADWVPLVPDRRRRPTRPIPCRPRPCAPRPQRDVARTSLLESMTEALRALFDEAGWIP